MSTEPTTNLRLTFIDAMSRAVTGVTVVTTDGPAGRMGQTVSAMSSVSADPPMLLVCINRKSPICAAINTHGVFAVSVLRADQRRIAESFAGRPRRGLAYDFSSAVWETAETGSPLLVGATATFDCRLDQTVDAGSHRIFIARVVTAVGGTGQPLTYSHRTYGEPAPFPARRGTENLFTGSFDDDDAVECNPEELWG